MKSHLKDSCFSPNKAFSLLELITVLFIIGIIATLTLPNYRSGQRTNDLITETNKVASVFRRAQTMALTGDVGAGSTKGDAYGVYISGASATTYKLFIDRGGDLGVWNNGTDESLQDFNLSANFEFGSVPCSSLAFTPPYAAVYCNGVAFSGDKTFSVKEVAEARYKYIRINSKGKIDILGTN